MNKLEPKLPAYVTAKAQEFLDNGGSFRKTSGKGRKYQVLGVNRWASYKKFN